MLFFFIKHSNQNNRIFVSYQNQVLSMRYFFIIILLICSSTSFAQTKTKDKIVLNSNEVFTGEILLQNDRSVIIKLADGSRYEIPVSEVRTITKEKPDSYPEKAQISEENEDAQKKVTLYTGESFIGNILIENEEFVMLQTKEKARFQFQKNDIQSIQNVEENEISENKFSMMPDIRGGVSYSKEAFGWAPELQISMLLGGTDLFIPNSFLGIGIGYHAVFPSDYNHGEVISFLPLFLSLRSTITKRVLAPYIEMNGGYSFALSDHFEGGFIFNVSVGISRKITARSSFQVGIYGGLHTFSANLTEERYFGNFEYYGKTTSKQVGIKASINF